MYDLPAGRGADGAVAEAHALHASLLTLDSHIDIPWPGGPDPWRPGPRRVDLPKMRTGLLRAGCFAAYVPQGPREAEGANRERALAMLEQIGCMGRGEGRPEGVEATPTRLCATAAEIEASFAAGAVAVVPAVENGDALGGDLATLERMRALGATYLTLCHNGHNRLCDSSNPRSDLGDGASLHGGLSGFGREAITELNRLGMLVDVSHVSRDAMMQALRASRTPVVATHSSARALCDVPRNLDDAQAEALAEAGGVVQVTAVPSFLRLRGRADTVGVEDFVDHVAHLVGRIGVAHVGIGSDFDGGGGVRGWADASEGAGLTAALIRRGFDAAEVAALWGGNFLRLMRQAEGAAG